MSGTATWRRLSPASSTGTGYTGTTTPNGAAGHHAKLLLDPYAKAVAGKVRWGQAVYSYVLPDGDDRVIDRTDSASAMPKSIVIDAAFEWANDHRPRTPWHDTVIYETHVRGLRGAILRSRHLSGVRMLALLIRH